MCFQGRVTAAVMTPTSVLHDKRTACLYSTNCLSPSGSHHVSLIHCPPLPFAFFACCRCLLLHQTTKSNQTHSTITAPLPARQSAHLELFGRPCSCRRCSVEASLPPELAAELQALADRAQVGVGVVGVGVGEWVRVGVA